MPSFKGFRINRGASGAGAGRGDSPYSHIKAPVPPPRGQVTNPAFPQYRSMVSVNPHSGVQTIGEMPPAQSVGLSDNKAARKANSPKAKAKALKAINKNPLKPSDSFASEAGFERSQESVDYDSARIAESRLKRNNYRDMPKSPSGKAGRTATEQKDYDEDTVGSYLATGKSQHSTEGQKWMKENSADTRRKRYG